MVAAFIILTCLLAKYVNMFNATESSAVQDSRLGGILFLSCANLESLLFTKPNTYFSTDQRSTPKSVHLCVQVWVSAGISSALIFQAPASERCIPVTHWSLILHTLLIAHTESQSNPSASSQSATRLLGEIAADVQGLLVHLSHVLQIS